MATAVTLTEANGLPITLVDTDGLPISGSRPRNRSVLFIGHSMITQMTTVSGTERSKLSQGVAGNLAFLSRQAFDFEPEQNYGVSGQNSSEILARIPAMLQASDAGTVVLLMTTNDPSGAIPVATTIANINAAVKLCRAAGRMVVILTDPPRGETNFTGARLSATNLKRQMQVRQHILGLAGTPGVYTVDTWPRLALANSTTGDCIGASFKDGLHPNYQGAYYMALACQPVFDFLFSPRDFIAVSNSGGFDATDNPFGNLIANPVMDGTGGSKQTNGSGDLADSWSENANPGATRVYSKVTANGRAWQQCVLGGNATSTGFSIRQVITAGNLTIGDKVRATVEVEWDNDMSNVVALAAQLLDNNTIFCGDMRPTDGTMRIPTIAQSGVMRTPVMTLTSTTLQFQMFLQLVNAAAIAGTFRFRGAEVRKV